MGISVLSPPNEADLSRPLAVSMETLQESLNVPVVIIVRCLVVERFPERLGAPKAHALSPRSLELLRQFHLDVKKIRQLGTRRRDAFWVNFLTNLSGQQVGVLPYERMDVDVLEDTPEMKMILNIPQPVFEEFVTDVVVKDPGAENLLLTSQDLDGVTTTVEERATGLRFQVRSKYLIACDGARSKVRTSLGIESDGEDSYETMMTIHFNADLRAIVGERVGMLHWIMDPLASGFIIAYELLGNAVLISNFDANLNPVESWNQELCRKVVVSALGIDVPFDILSYRPWLLSRKVARSYRKGNVFLAGDAAHSFPPTGGLGLNSYKIAFVLKGLAGDRLLDTYETERRPVAIVNSMQSVKNGKQIFALLKTLGIGEDVVTARRNLYANIKDPEKMKAIALGIEGQREHFDNLELHIGYVYGSDTIPPHASRYTPKFQVGARLPHAWIRLPCSPLKPVDVSYVEEFSPEDVELRQYSTLDLCDLDKFTLIGELEVAGVKTCVPGKDFDVVGEAGQQWLKGAGLQDGGGLLVRPDQHILMLLDADTKVEEVESCLKQHLHG
ncbi:3-(3-hydroxy-phenyl)propionate hydroxylase [Cladophialophora carrionii]|uniref:3-(3-hydroxy-phenyl)propionate hydroxylase n=1 Tax=Cladophialophora carrionii TaxID=86049 RepID=A0A1C1CL04_9EURO|nr:3-(3-hydroxy-phenyl)propionate hydroxylase [Cladophialophora carrionii]